MWKGLCGPYCFINPSTCDLAPLTRDPLCEIGSEGPNQQLMRRGGLKAHIPPQRPMEVVDVLERFGVK